MSGYKPIPDDAPAVEFRKVGSNVVMPGHYAKYKIEPIRFIQENRLDPLQGKVVKYVTRFRDKNGIEDLNKAKRCLEMLIDYESGIAEWWLPESMRGKGLLVNVEDIILEMDQEGQSTGFARIVSEQGVGD